MLSSSTASVQHLAQLLERIDLDLNLDEMAGGGLRALEHRANAAGDGNVVVFNQHGVIQPETVVETAAATNRVFFERAQARRRLAGTADARTRAGDTAHELVRRGRHPREASQQIERGAFGAKHGACRPRHRHQLGFGRDARAVAHIGGNVDLRRKLGKGRGHERQARDHARRARHDDGAGRCVFGDRGGRGDIAGAAEILGQRARDRRIDLER